MRRSPQLERSVYPLIVLFNDRIVSAVYPEASFARSKLADIRAPSVVTPRQSHYFGRLEL